MPRLVTGYIRLDSAHRSHESYVALGNRLLGLGLPTTVFLDKSGTQGIVAPPSATVLPASIEGCWLSTLARDAETPQGSPQKDTAAFHAVQAQKSSWLATASEEESAFTPLVWVDFGVLHVPGVTEDAIVRFVRRAADVSRMQITAATIWGPPTHPVSADAVSWHFAGGVLVVPAWMARWFHAEVQRQASLLLATEGMVTWEVNYWAAVAREHPEKFAWWQCDHDGSLFDNGP